MNSTVVPLYFPFFNITAGRNVTTVDCLVQNIQKIIELNDK